MDTPDVFTVSPEGAVYIRSRESGDTIRLRGGSKSLKKLFIDRKIPAAQRSRIPVVCDEAGILGVWSIGANRDRPVDQNNTVTIRFKKKEIEGE